MKYLTNGGDVIDDATGKIVGTVVPGYRNWHASYGTDESWFMSRDDAFRWVLAHAE